MRRRDFLGTAIGAVVLQSSAFGRVFAGKETDDSATFAAPIGGSSFATTKQKGVAPMAIGVMIAPTMDHPEIAIARVKELGMSNCFLNLDDYIGKFSPSAADQLSAALAKQGVIATSVEIVGPGRLCGISGWDRKPLDWCHQRRAPLGLRHSTDFDFAKHLGIPRVQTHCGFLPEIERSALSTDGPGNS